MTTEKQEEALWGIGFIRLSEHRKRMLKIILLASAGAHLLGLAIFGGYILIRPGQEEALTFQQPPPVKRYKPKKLEHRVKVRNKQKSSSRPSMVPRIVASKPSRISLPEIEMDPKVLNTSFQPKFKTVSGVGVGAGVGDGFGLGGFGGGVASFNFFGIRGRGSKVAVVVDVSVSMVEEERGGPAGFLRVKRRLNDVIDAVPQGAMFNVIAFANACQTWKDELQDGLDSKKREAMHFIAPFNVEGNWGLDHGNFTGVDAGLKGQGGTTRLDLALSAALSMGADTILIISDGLPRVKKAVDAGAMAAYRRRRAQWERTHADELRRWRERKREADANARYETKKVWVPPKPAIPAPTAPPKEGQKQRGPRPAQPGRYVTRRVRVGGGDPGPKPTPPPPPKTGQWTLQDFLRHLELLTQEYYEDKGKKPPRIHCIGYQIDREGGEFLRKISNAYGGRYRLIKRLR
mgnify:FL=1